MNVQQQQGKPAVWWVQNGREARELIAALQWSLGPAEQLTGEVAA